jgi:high-affinity nickel permease
MNISPLSVLILGFLLGLKHATDADHVVAVTTIVSRQKKLRHAALVGITWGIGHTFMIIVVGIAMIVFRVNIPEKTQLSFELIVAVTLVILGFLNLTGVMGKLAQFLSRFHTHTHSHSEQMTTHDHPPVETFVTQHGLFHLIRPLIVGIIHGLAGSAAVALLVLGSISDQTTGMIYLAIFGVGTIVGMMIITTLLGIPLLAGSKKFGQFDRVATIIAGILSIGYGMYFGVEIAGELMR